ncbi:hypothetical protein [Actinoplanes flavus]|uniref:hypothetical protein n=1 Tax=Actinoplanes flavus TaxID=2820290 RepID=UPI001ABCCA04|nr:hypothetical protein [Actinoplanes flavus]
MSRTRRPARYAPASAGRADIAPAAAVRRPADPAPCTRRPAGWRIRRGSATFPLRRV